MPKPNTPTQTPLFEENIDQLTRIVESLEKDTLPIEEALSQFEQGVTLVKNCQSALHAAEQKIQALSNNTPPNDE